MNDTSLTFDSTPSGFNSGVFSTAGVGNAGCSPPCNNAVWGSIAAGGACSSCNAQLASLFAQVQSCPCDQTLSNTTLGDYVFPEGIYCFTNPLTVTGTVTTIGGVGSPQTVIRAPQLTIAAGANIYYNTNSSTAFAKLIFYSNSTLDFTWQTTMRFNATFMSEGNFAMNWQVNTSNSPALYDSAIGLSNANFTINVPSTLSQWSAPNMPGNIC